MPDQTRIRTRSKPSITANLTLNRTKPYSETTVLGSYTTLSHSETMIDLVTPDFHNRRKKGELIENNMSYVLTSTTGGTGSASYQSNDGVNQYSLNGPVTAFRVAQSGVPDLVLDFDPLPDLIRDARSACLAAINSATVATGEDIKEANKTLALLRNPIKGISTNLKRVERDMKRRKGKLAAAKNITKFLTDYWLEYRFAFSPLVRSVENILLEAQKTVPPRYNLFEVAHGRKTGTFKRERTINRGGSIFKQTCTVNIKVHAYVRYNLRGSSNFGNGRRWGTRLRDHPDTMWQVMPLSFMIDRVFNVSNVINGIVNLLDPNVSCLNSGNTYRIETILTTQYIGDDNPEYSKTIAAETIEKKVYSYSREQWSPDVADTIPSPSMKNLVSNAAYLADLTSLILGKFNKR